MIGITHTSDAHLSDLAVGRVRASYGLCAFRLASVAKSKLQGIPNASTHHYRGVTFIDQRYFIGIGSYMLSSACHL